MSDEKDQRKVTGIKEIPAPRRGRPAATGESKDKPDKKALLCSAWYRLINREMPVLAGHEFPGRYHVWEPESGKRLLLEELPGEVVQVVPRTALETAVSSYSHKALQKTQLCLSPDTARAVAAHWMNVAPPVDEPRPFSWADEAGLTFHRLPWVRGEADPSGDSWPTWRGMLARMKNRDAFMAFIGSLFVQDAKHQQYCWVYGEGKDGKGTINHFLSRVFGPAYVSKQTPNKGREHFWAYNLLGKRCVVFPDCSDPHFVRNGLFKAMVGRDPIELEQKGQTSFTKPLSAMFLFFSNDRPRITSQLADTRRLVLCEFDPASIVVDPTFQQKLWDEGGAFLDACLQKYQAMCPDHGAIPTDERMVAECVDVHEFEVEAIFETYFLMKPESPAEWLTAGDLRRILEAARVPAFYRSHLLSWLKRKHGVKQVQRWRNGRNEKAYQGLCSAAGPADAWGLAR